MNILRCPGSQILDMTRVWHDLQTSCGSITRRDNSSATIASSQLGHAVFVFLFAGSLKKYIKEICLGVHVWKDFQLISCPPAKQNVLSMLWCHFFLSAQPMFSNVKVELCLFWGIKYFLLSQLHVQRRLSVSHLQADFFEHPYQPNISTLAQSVAWIAIGWNTFMNDQWPNGVVQGDTCNGLKSLYFQLHLLTLMVQKWHNSAQVELIKISLIILKYMVKSYRVKLTMATSHTEQIQSSFIPPSSFQNQRVNFIGFPI